MKRIFIKQIIVNIFLMIILITLGCTCISMKTYAESRQAVMAKKEYSKMLSKNSIMWTRWSGQRHETRVKVFSCVDMNNDNIPELILYCFNAYGYEGGEQVYTYENGKVKCIFTSGMYDTVKTIYPSRKLFIVEGARGGVSWRYYQVLEKEKYVEKAGEWREDFGRRRQTYVINREKVSKAEYKKFTSALTKGETARSFKFRSNTKANRIKYLSTPNPSIKITTTKTTFTIGASYTFKASKKNTSAKITWSVSDKSLASIGKTTGRFKALKPGKITVYATIGKVKTGVNVQINKKIVKWKKDVYTDFVKNIKRAPKVYVSFSVNQAMADFDPGYRSVLSNNYSIDGVKYITKYAIKDLNKDNISELIINTGSFIHIYTQKKEAVTNKFNVVHVVSVIANYVTYGRLDYARMYWDSSSGTIMIDNVGGMEALNEMVSMKLGKNYEKNNAIYYDGGQAYHVGGGGPFRINKKAVSKSTFDKVINKYCKKSNQIIFSS